MTKTGRMGATMVAMMAMAGCYEHTYTVGEGAPVAPVVYDEWHHHWLGGLIGERTMEIERFCPSGDATVHNEQSFLNGLVSALTGGIYTPTTVTIRCDDGRRADLELDEGEIMTILNAPAFLERVEDLVPDRLDEATSGVRALQQDNQD